MSLDVRSIQVRIDDVDILASTSFHVPTGATYAVVGPSGAGKSTLLRVIAGIMAPSSGSVLIDGSDVIHMPAHRRNVGLVFQDDQLFTHMSVADNIAFGLDVSESMLSTIGYLARVRRSRHSVERAKRIDDLLDLVGLPGFATRSIGSLSGGESKRVALARALAPVPAVLLLDEPLTGLDRALHDRLMSDLKDVLERTHTTAVLVTHDETEAEFLAARIVRLGDREGSRTLDSGEQR